MTLRGVKPGTDKPKEIRSHGEAAREASRARDLRDWQAAVNKGYRNKAIEERMRK